MKIFLGLLRFMFTRPIRRKVIRALAHAVKTQPRGVLLGDDESDHAFMISRRLPGSWSILRTHVDDVREIESDFNVGFPTSSLPMTQYQVVWGDSVSKTDWNLPVKQVGDSIEALEQGHDLGAAWSKFAMDLRMGTWMPTEQEILDLAEQVARARPIDEEDE